MRKKSTQISEVFTRKNELLDVKSSCTTHNTIEVVKRCTYYFVPLHIDDLRMHLTVKCMRICPMMQVYHKQAFLRTLTYFWADLQKYYKILVLLS
jgi:hypothetical protein